MSTDYSKTSHTIVPLTDEVQIKESCFFFFWSDTTQLQLGALPALVPRLLGEEKCCTKWDAASFLWVDIISIVCCIKTYLLFLQRYSISTSLSTFSLTSSRLLEMTLTANSLPVALWRQEATLECAPRPSSSSSSVYTSTVQWYTHTIACDYCLG